MVEPIIAQGSEAVDVSIVVCTFDRPAALEVTLGHLTRQKTDLRLEIIVVDNHPESGLTPPIVRSIAGARLISESRRGLSAARNAGIRQARGRIIVMTDDDTESPETWLDSIASPIVSGGFDAVAGTTLPVKVDTPAERLFEAYGGHGHRDEAAEYNGDWLRSNWWRLPLWQIGTTANAAFRAEVFQHPDVGMIEETLGAGTAPGSWEDLYLFYRMLGAGYRIRHEPAAWLRHRHRETMPELVKQIEAYRRGEVGFCLLLLFRHRDFRALTHLLAWLPWYRISLLAREILNRLRRKPVIPFRLMLREVVAYAGGFRALWRARGQR